MHEYASLRCLFAFVAVVLLSLSWPPMTAQDNFVLCILITCVRFLPRALSKLTRLVRVLHPLFDSCDLHAHLSTVETNN